MKKYYYEEYRDLYDHSNKMRKHLLSLSEPYINDKDIGLYFKVLISNSESGKLFRACTLVAERLTERNLPDSFLWRIHL